MFLTLGESVAPGALAPSAVYHAYLPVVSRSGWPVQPPLIGVYYFNWYRSKTEGWGNDSHVVGPEATMPALGWYASDDPTVIRAHLDQISAVGFDFVVLNVVAENPTIWENIRAVFREAEGRPIRLAIMLDGLYQASPAAKRAWVAHVLREYGDHPNYLRLQGRPLVLLYSARLDFAAPEATLRNVYWAPSYHQALSEDWPFWDPTPQLMINGVVPVMPGYDDRSLGRERSMYYPRDEGQLYRDQWERALALRPRIITVYSWNEHFELTAIEPTERWGDLYLRLTRCFITRAKTGSIVPCP